METPEETDLVEHLQSLKDLPGGFGLAFAGAAEETIRLRENDRLALTTKLHRPDASFTLLRWNLTAQGLSNSPSGSQTGYRD
jgi:hypothetical protein